MLKYGIAPYLECSSKGDKRFSAFYARINAYGGKTIEEIYQASKVFADGSTGLSTKEAKGRQAVNMAYCHDLYSDLWDTYFMENPELLDVVYRHKGFSDIFGQPDHCCQAAEIYKIWRKHWLVNINKAAEKYAGLVFNKHHGNAPADAIYCGRGSIWGNQFTHLDGTKANVKVRDREEAVIYHKIQLKEDVMTGKVDINALVALKDKPLVCFCAPQLCHCYTLLAAADYYSKQLS